MDNELGFAGDVGACGDMDTDVWGDPVETALSYAWGFGYGPLDETLATALEDAWGDDYLAREEEWVGGYTYTDYEGTGSVYAFNYGLAFETDENLEIVVDDDSYLVALPGASFTYAEQAYYRSYYAYGWSL